MRVRPVRILLTSFALAALFVLGWLLLYPQESDPKNIKYVLWKAGVYKLNIAVAVGTMIGDSARENLVVGKTKVQIENRFGSLLAPVDATPCLRNCYRNTAWKDRKVFFIRNSSWMVVFDGEKAIDLVLIKGC